MTNFEKVMNVWRDLETVYKKKGKGKSRREFLESLANESSLVRLRSTIMSDIDEANVGPANELLSVIADAYERSQKVNTIDDLNEFVWENAPEAVDLEEFSIILKDSYSLGIDLLNKNFCNSYYRLLPNGSVESNVLDPKDSVMRHFEDSTSVILWLNLNANSVESDRNEFVDRIYAYLIKGVLSRNLVLPLTLVNRDKVSVSSYNESGEESNSFVTTAKTKFNCDFNWYLRNFKGKVREEQVVYL